MRTVLGQNVLIRIRLKSNGIGSLTNKEEWLGSRRGELKMNKMLREVFDELAASCLGGEINLEASEKESGENYIHLHFWDGRRFMLTCAKEPRGCAYDPHTGKLLK